MNSPNSSVTASAHLDLLFFPLLWQLTVTKAPADFKPHDGGDDDDNDEYDDARLTLIVRYDRI
jgi:hypothetical protein